jgi:OOP family OmpA-OmpF porin
MPRISPTRLLLLAALGCALAATTASGQNRAGADSISPHVGVYVFDDDQNLETSGLYGLGLGYNLDEHWTGEVVFDYVNAEVERYSETDVDVFNYRLEGLYHFMPEKKLVPFLAGGLGGVTYDPDGGKNDTDFLISYGAGLKYFIRENLALRGDVRHIVSFEKTQNNFAASVGITFFFGGKDEKATPAPAAALTPPPATDRDGDGVPDSADKCPNTPGGTTVDTHGCTSDLDGDKIGDDQDQCPDTPTGAEVDARGCWVLRGVQFETGKSELHPNSYPTLDAVLAVLEQNLELKVEVEGHTDNTGSADFNQGLSERRAQTVLDYFAGKGIDATRLSAHGYGSTKPAATNETEAGRTENRRVELRPQR